jgi:Uma2 family endonuclease
VTGDENKTGDFMNWTEVINNPALRDLPFKIETNEWGQIVMSAATNKHGILQMKIGSWFEKTQTSGLAISECSVATDKGVKVADVVWCSAAFLEKNGYETPYQESPEVCVEIVSRSNSKREMREKRRLYFERGAREVWLCHENGKVEFYNAKSEIEQSAIFTDFPKQIEVFWR